MPVKQKNKSFYSINNLCNIKSNSNVQYKNKQMIAIN